MIKNEGDIQQKLEVQGIGVSSSSTTWALKSENTITKTECRKMF